MNRRVSGFIALLSFALLLLTPKPALAHGEVAQEPFLREDTVAFFDVQFSTTTIKQGDPLTITGKFLILDTWPRQLPQPDLAFLSVTTPGPVVMMTAREIDGQSAPMSVYVQKGKMYDFKMTVVGRTPGDYHIHPALYIKDAGPLIGPGQWITVQEAPGGFQFPVTLLNGTKIADLQTFETPFMLGFTILSVIIGLVWLVYWTVPKPTVTRLAITNLIPSNDIGSDFGLITGRDIRNVSIIAGVALLVIVGGFAYMAARYPVVLPPQVIRFTPPTLPDPPRLVEVHAQQSSYDPQSHTLTLKATVKNVSDQAISVDHLTIANFEFIPGTPRLPWQVSMGVDGATVDPGQTRDVTLKVVGDLLDQERLIPLADPIEQVGGVLVFKDAKGIKNYVPATWPIVLTSFFNRAY